MLPKKRPFHDGGDGDEQGSKQLNDSANDDLANVSVDEFVLKLEPYLRVIVRETALETLTRLFQQSPRPSSSCDQPESSKRRCFLLHFVDQVPSTIFTNSKIETEDGNPIQVVLLDANTNSIVTSDPLSSMKVAVVALDGDFGSNGLEDWSESEFVDKVIHERHGRRPLLIGELTITLKNGVGKIDDVSFSDNSSWIRCRKFRLGILPMEKSYGNVRVREARSGAFVVKDQRGETYKKHFPPHQNDDIWRLVKISKDGAYYGRLVSNGIYKVKDFLQLHTTHPYELRKMFEVIPNKTWNTIIRHASTCSVDNDELYIYYVAGQGIALLFNSIYKLIGAALDGQNFEEVHKLSLNQMALVENWKEQAYKNTKDFIQISARVVFGPSRPLSTMQFPEPDIEMLQLGLLFPNQDQPYTQLELDNASSSMSCPIEIKTEQQANVSSQAFPTNTRKLGDTFPLLYTTGDTNWATGTSQWPLVTSCTPRIKEDISGIQTSTRLPFNPTTWGQGSHSFILSSTSDDELGWFLLVDEES